MTRSSDEHPDELALCDYADALLEDSEEQRVRAHVDVCDLCEAVIERISRDQVPPARPSTVPTSPARVPRALVQTMTNPRVVSPAPGQCWRLEWEGCAEAGFILGEGRDGRLQVAAVAEDPHLAGPGTVRVEPGRSPLGYAVAVCPGLTAEVAGFVFDCLLGELPEVLAAEPSTEPPDEGIPVRDPVRRYRTALADGLEFFQAVEWLPEAAEEASPLNELAGRRGVDVDDIADALDIGVSQALALLRGQREPEPGQRRELAELLGVDPDEIGSPELPPGLVQELNRVEWRPRVRARARRTGDSERQTYRKLAFHAAAAPATRRRKGRSKPGSWRQVLDAILSDEP